jgi:hypothetical protein
MARKWLALCAIGIVCFSAIFFAISLRADGPQPDAKSAAPFAGKVLAVTTRSSTEYGNIIEEATMTELGGETFLVGKGVPDDEEDTWYGGRTVWIAISDVSQIVEFANRDEFRKAKEKEEGKAEARNAAFTHRAAR